MEAHLNGQTDALARHHGERPNAAADEDVDEGATSAEFWSNHENRYNSGYCDYDRVRQEAW